MAEPSIEDYPRAEAAEAFNERLNREDGVEDFESTQSRGIHEHPIDLRFSPDVLFKEKAAREVFEHIADTAYAHSSLFGDLRAVEPSGRTGKEKVQDPLMRRLYEYVFH